MDIIKIETPFIKLDQLLKILKDDETIVEMSVKNNSVMFSFDNYTIIARLLEGEFFD